MFDINAVTVTSRQNPTIKKICSLSSKKGRREEGLFRFDGIKLFHEAVKRQLNIKYVVVREDKAQEIMSSAAEYARLSDAAFLIVPSEVFEKLSEEASPEGVITVAHFVGENHRELDADMVNESYPEKDEKILIAESLRDPGNLGTVIRSCAALGIHRLIISSDCADIYNPKTVRAAMGGLFGLKIDIFPEGSLPSVIKGLRQRGRKVYAAAVHGDALKIGGFKMNAADTFVIGNEGHGLSEDTVSACDACAIIPMTEGSESLNAAAAAAICIWEIVKNS